MTLLEVLQSTTAFFAKRGVESPRLNAEHLLAHALKRKRIELYLEFERVLTEAELAPLRDLVRRRGQGEPLQHLLGTVEFAGQTFLCDKRALVPRPETKQFVELLKSRIENRSTSGGSKILDVGTGSGVIALSLAALFPEAVITATDISDDALALARENATRLDLANRVTFLKSDLMIYVSHGYQVIVANLPYVAEHDRGTLSREVLHDPEIALFGGEHGDEIVRKLIEAAPSHLAPGGLLALELALGQGDALSALMAKKNYHDIELERDYAGVIRFLFGRYG
jgi:release factor glutamine methyltransferase